MKRRPAGAGTRSRWGDLTPQPPLPPGEGEKNVVKVELPSPGGRGAGGEVSRSGLFRNARSVRHLGTRAPIRSRPSLARTAASRSLEGAPSRQIHERASHGTPARARA